MHKRYSQILILLFLALDTCVNFCCRGSERKELASPFRDELLKIENALAAEPLTYADMTHPVEFRPENLYWEENMLWVWSKVQPQQVGFRKVKNKFAEVATRRGPPGTTRCHVVPHVTLCLGDQEPGGIRAVRGQFHHALPRIKGYGDFDINLDGRMLVYNQLVGVVYLLNPIGNVEREIPVGEGVSCLGFLDGNYFWSTSYNPPGISIWNLETRAEVSQFKLIAPVRDAVFDQTRNTLWTIGPADRPVRRADGPVENLYTVIYTYQINGKDGPHPHFFRKRERDLRRKLLIDGAHLWLTPDVLYASATGSNNIFGLRLTVPGEEPIGILSHTGRAPQGVLAVGSDIFTADRVSNTITRFQANDDYRTEKLPLSGSDRGPKSPGEVLFYDGMLWSADATFGFSCNSCHWDGLTDHRLHPGLLESRYEMTRPVMGIRMVAPVFTPMQALTLTDAVEGLFQTLDHRFWSGEIKAATFFTETLPGAGLSPLEARKALLQYLMNTRPEWGPMRQPNGEFSALAVAGSKLFLRDCGGCHESTSNMRTRRALAPEELLQRLKQGPLSFGAPFYREAGVKPYYTANGNRTTPLISLGRGGPFFSNGGARSLREVVGFFTPADGRQNVHGSSKATGFYSRQEIEQLVEFLLSI